MPKLKTIGEIRIQSGDISREQLAKLGAEVLEDLKDAEFQSHYQAISKAINTVRKSAENELQIFLTLAEKENLSG